MNIYLKSVYYPKRFYAVIPIIILMSIFSIGFGIGTFLGTLLLGVFDIAIYKDRILNPDKYIRIRDKSLKGFIRTLLIALPILLVLDAMWLYFSFHGQDGEEILTQSEYLFKYAPAIFLSNIAGMVWSYMGVKTKK